MSELHKVEHITITESSFSAIIDGQQREFPLAAISAKLIQASDLERNTFEVTPSGYGIHWPLLDEDLSIDALLGVAHYPLEQRKIA